MMTTRNYLAPLAAQRGMTLIVALIFMIVLTLFVTAGVRSTLMQERMSGYSWEQNLAFQAAEYAAREGERIVATAVINPTDMSDSCTQGKCKRGYLPDVYLAATWDDNASTKKYVEAPTANSAWSSLTPALADQPKYMIEHAGSAKCAKSEGCEGGKTELYRVIGRGVGRVDTSTSLVQTTYKP